MILKNGLVLIDGNLVRKDIEILDGNAKLKAIAELASGNITDESMKFAEMLMG